MYLYIYSLVFVYTISENGPMPSLLAEATLTLYSVRWSSLVMTVLLSSLDKFIFVFSNLLLYSKTYPVISPFLLAQGTPDQLTVMEEDLICETLTDWGGPPGTVWEIENNKSQIYCVTTNFSSTRTYKREVELLIIYFFCECVNIIWYSSWANCYNTIKVTINLKQLPNFLGLRTVLVVLVYYSGSYTLYSCSMYFTCWRCCVGVGCYCRGTNDVCSCDIDGVLLSWIKS